MRRFISPPKNQLDKLRQTLTPGEKIVFEFFDTYLHKRWEIYIQPHLNGLRPDFVLLNPEVGIAVFEVKDWDLDAMIYSVKNRQGKPPILLGQKDGKSFSLQNENPIEKVYRYKKEIHELYCPRLKKKAGFGVITAGVIFPFAESKYIRELFMPCRAYRGMLRYERYYPISGADDLKTKAIHSVFPEGIRTRSYCMKPELAMDLRNWLVEPDFAATQRMPLEVDETQKRYITTRTTSGYRRIKGPAGSGKSLILAARAAHLLSESKEILVITYNITLLHYLMDIAVRWPHTGGNTRKNITWLNFHSWCKRVCQESDHEEEYDALWRNYLSEEEELFYLNFNKDEKLKEILNIHLPSLVSSIIDADVDNVIQVYDAILVDEGQDFLPNWWGVLRKVCKKEGEMLLVADATQDIYDTAQAWTEQAMKGAGFSGPWIELPVSYRLPPSSIKYICSFAKQFLPKDLVDLPVSPQEELELFPCKLRWIQTSKERAADVCQNEILLMAPSAYPELLAIPDITFLAGNQKFGREVVGKIGMKGIKTVHTFGNDSRESRRMKMGFYMGDARIKATTLHSFKGWESRALVLYIGHARDKRSRALIYTGMTRLKRHVKGSFLTVVCSAAELEEYGETWPDFEVE